MAEKVSVSFPGWMLEAIDDRRGNVPRSVWVQYAIQARLNAEDQGDWEEPELAVADGGEEG